jgi:protein-S-isoprenylcysteine O-methyltransferase Ste14
MTSPRPALVLAPLSVAIWLGLAVAAEGGPARFFALPPLVALTAALIALAVAAQFSQGHLGSGVREVRSNRWVIAAFTILGLALALLPPLSDRFDALTFGGDGVRWIGVAIGAAGGVLRLAPVFVLGRRFSGLVAIQPGHTLVTDGLYGVIRHPSYLGLLATAVGWSLAFRSGVGLIITALIALVLVARMNAEERLLAETFGAEYQAYRARTWRLVPYVY